MSEHTGVIHHAETPEAGTPAACGEASLPLTWTNHWPAVTCEACKRRFVYSASAFDSPGQEYRTAVLAALVEGTAGPLPDS